MGCPVQEGFDPLSDEFLADPSAVLAALPDEPVFYAPSLDDYVVTRYADVEAVFLDPKTYSAATAQRPLIALEPEALKILAEGGTGRSPRWSRSTRRAHAPAPARLARVHQIPFHPEHLVRGPLDLWATAGDLR